MMNAVSFVLAMAARVSANGQRVKERLWTCCAANAEYGFLDDRYVIPARYVSGADEITVRIEPLSENWNFCRYRVCCGE